MTYAEDDFFTHTKNLLCRSLVKVMNRTSTHSRFFSVFLTLYILHFFLKLTAGDYRFNHYSVVHHHDKCLNSKKLT